MTSTYHFGLLILRITFSAMMLTHGIPKLLSVLQGDFGFSDPIGIGSTLSKILVVIAEVVCPLFIILGYKTRLATIPPMIAMLVVAFVVNSGNDFSSQEKALLFASAFLVMALTGAGKFSIDKK